MLSLPQCVGHSFLVPGHLKKNFGFSAKFEAQNVFFFIIHSFKISALAPRARARFSDALSCATVIVIICIQDLSSP